jgi:NMD protein affecting ribosome stability and mRNA decay
MEKCSNCGKQTKEFRFTILLKKVCLDCFTNSGGTIITDDQVKDKFPPQQKQKRKRNKKTFSIGLSFLDNFF